MEPGGRSGPEGKVGSRLRHFEVLISIGMHMGHYHRYSNLCMNYGVRVQHTGCVELIIVFEY